MARPKKNNAEYFTHDADMRNDLRIRALRRKFSHEGYAVWNYLLETLTDSDFFRIEWSEINIELMAADFEMSVDMLRSIVDYCIGIKLFQKEGGYIFSKTHIKRFAGLVSNRERKRVNAAEMLPSPSNKEVMPRHNSAETTEYNVNDGHNRHSIVEESKGEYSRVEESKEENTHTQSLVKNSSHACARDARGRELLDWLAAEFPAFLTMAHPLTLEQADGIMARLDFEDVKRLFGKMASKKVPERCEYVQECFTSYESRDYILNERKGAVGTSPVYSYEEVCDLVSGGKAKFDDFQMRKKDGKAYWVRK